MKYNVIEIIEALWIFILILKIVLHICLIRQLYKWY